MGLFQDELNRPILYHIKRHKNNKKIPIDNFYNMEMTYSREIPDLDTNNFLRANTSTGG